MVTVTLLAERRLCKVEHRWELYGSVRERGLLPWSLDVLKLWNVNLGAAAWLRKARIALPYSN